MIFGFDPEHGDRRDAVFLRDARGELRGGESFVKREQRTAEQSGLLAGDDRDGIRLGEARGRVASGRGAFRRASCVVSRALSSAR